MPEIDYFFSQAEIDAELRDRKRLKEEREEEAAQRAKDHEDFRKKLEAEDAERKKS